MHPGSHESVSGEQYVPATHPVTEQSGGTGWHPPLTQMEPKPQSEACAHPAAHALPAQWEPYGQPPAGQVAGGVLHWCTVGSQYWPLLHEVVPAQPTWHAPEAALQ